MNQIAERVEDFLRKAPSPERAALIPQTVGTVAPPPLLYAVGDIHGMRGKLDRLLEVIEADAEIVARDAVVVFLGDLINRGPASRQVLERLIAGPRRAGDRWITLRGNHDQLFIDAIGGRSEAAFEQLLRKGGLETLASYGVRKKDVSLALSLIHI